VHAAPPVRVSLGRSAGWTTIVCLCTGFAVANIAAWVLLRNEAPVVVALILGLFAAVLTVWRMQRSQTPSDLVWNGSQWQWQGLAGEVQVALDLGLWMLLRFDPLVGRRCWIPASRASAFGPWAALRAALYARRPADPLAP
jgi:hypothetical protein